VAPLRCRESRLHPAPPEGPPKCSGLEVMRYDADSLHDQFGARFRLIESSQELHETPQGITQQFLYCYCRVE
jgi:hypothetical protein